ncbi:hypothetical protein EXIGLDRAFT_524303 [Exidia glandulosa HHB12029]|uniref:Uncharacterized protein n=1 Tax=Exidia glandulosa HHB12029 TaxID=1314781 RepID=A0A165J1F2_EXIGL|nr:hypothetical protein EXIGLDRAFT_524303 [Exidia glandulosa HHB12029]
MVQIDVTGDRGWRASTWHNFSGPLAFNHTAWITLPAALQSSTRSIPPDEFGEETQPDARIWTLNRDVTSPAVEARNKADVETLDVLLLFLCSRQYHLHSYSSLSRASLPTIRSTVLAFCSLP